MASMAFRVLPDGVIETDSAEEALEVSRRLQGSKVAPKSDGKPVERAAAPGPKMLELMSALRASIERAEDAADPAHLKHEPVPEIGSAEQLRRLKMLLASAYTIHTKALFALGHRGTMTISELRQAYGLSTNNEAAGMIRALRLTILRAGLDPKWVLVRDPLGPSRGDNTRYRASRLLVIATKETSMPDEPTHQEEGEKMKG